MSLPITLLVYPTLPKIRDTRSHWCLFMPSPSNTTDQELGTILQITGTPFTGYYLDTKHSYNLSIPVVSSPLPVLKYHLGDMDEGKIGEVEEEAGKVEVPGVSKEPLNPVGRCCQEWVRDLVDRLVERGILKEGARGVLDEAKEIEVSRNRG